MFGLLNDDEEDSHQSFAQVPQWSEKVWLAGEKDTLGLYLTGHPINQYLAEMPSYTSCKISDLKPTGKEGSASIAGLVIGVRVMTNKKGRRWGIVTLDDRSGRVEARLFPDTFEQYEEMLQSDRVLYVQGQVSFDEYSGGNTMTIRSILDIVDAREHYVKSLQLTLIAPVDEDIVNKIKHILSQAIGGTCPVDMYIEHSGFNVGLRTDSQWYVSPSDQLIHDLKELLGTDAVRLQF